MYGLRDKGAQLTGLATILSMRTKLHATIKVSTEFEKVCVWYVQVTYDDATRSMATRR